MYPLRNFLRWWIVLCYLVVSMVSLHAVTLGGIITKPKYWIKADTITVDDGDPVSNWDNIAGTQANISQGDTKMVPLYRENAINFNPGVDFDGVNDSLVSKESPTEKSGVINIFLVAAEDKRQKSTLFSFFDSHIGMPRFQSHYPWSNGRIYFDTGNLRADLRTRIYAAAPFGVGEATIGTFINDVNSRSAIKQALFVNGKKIVSDNTAVDMNLKGMRIGADHVGNYYNGKVAELIVFNKNLSSNEKQRIHSYLALKYGITLNQSHNGGQNYLDSDGSTIWSASRAGAYRYDIFGIGQDAGSELDQRISKSVNPDGILVLSSDDDFTRSNVHHISVHRDKEFTILSNNHGGASWTASVLSSFSRIGREWKVQKSGGATKLYLQVNVDNDNFNIAKFSGKLYFWKTNTSKPVPMTNTGNGKWECLVDLNDGDTFTFVTESHVAPGSVTNNLKMWLRADSGIKLADKGHVNVWENLAGEMNLLQNRNNPGLQPTFYRDVMNFNPALNFDGKDDLISGYSPFRDGSEITVITVVREDRRQKSSIFSLGGGSNASRFQAHYPWSNSAIYFDAGSVYGKRRIVYRGAIPFGVGEASIGTFVNSVSDRKQAISVNGRTIVEDNSGHPYNLSKVQLGGFSNMGRHRVRYSGAYGEFLMYNRSLSESEKHKIHSYLAIKYGITLDQKRPQNYINSNGDVVWDATKNRDYRFDIIGIGRDDHTSLDQRISKSTNKDGILTISIDNNFESANLNHRAALSDKQFFFVSNNNADAKSWSVVKVQPGFKRIKREWKVEETNSVGTIYLQIDVSNSHMKIPDFPTGSDILYLSVNGGTPQPMIRNGKGKWKIAQDFKDGDKFTFMVKDPDAHSNNADGKGTNKETDGSNSNSNGNSDNQNSAGNHENNSSNTGASKGNGNSQNNHTNNSKENKTHLVVGYLPSWSINWFTESSAANSQMVKVDPLYTHIVISFAKPDMTYSKGSFTNTGIGFSASFSAVKQAIELLHKKNKKVLLAVGGATYNMWTELIEEQGKRIEDTVHKKALFNLIKDMKIDGIDVDYELPGADKASVEKYYKAILSLHEVAKEAGVMLSVAGWSTGADCTVLTTDDASCQGKISHWGGNAGRERAVFNKLKTNGYNPEDTFDYVSIMSYDGSVNRFDPVVLYKNYRSIYAGDLAIGFEIPREAWGGAEIVASNVEAEACEETSMVTGNSYVTYTKKQPYSVERLVGYINRDAHGGVMLWSLYKRKNSTECDSALDYVGFNAAVKRYLGKESSQEIVDTTDSSSNSGNGSSTTEYSNHNTSSSGNNNNTTGNSNHGSKDSNSNASGSGYPHYPENIGNYVVGTIVYGTDGRLYRCPKYPSWCNGPSLAYAPKSGYAWNTAWEVFTNENSSNSTKSDKTKESGNKENNASTGSTSNENDKNTQTEGSGSTDNSGSKENNASTESTGNEGDKNTQTEGSGSTDNSGSKESGQNSHAKTTEEQEHRSVIDNFEVLSKELGWSSKVVIKYIGHKPLDMKGSTFRLKGYEIYTRSSMTCEGVSWFAVNIDGNSSNGVYYTTLKPQLGDDSWIDSKIEKGQKCIITFSPSVIDKYSTDDFDLDDVSVIVKGVENSSGMAKPYREDPVSLKVKGWPATLAMGTVTDNAIGSAQALADSKIESIFKYDGDGFGDRGSVITPNVSLQTVHLARAIEALDKTGKKRVMPTLIVYTANGSGGGLAPEDIINKENLIKHFRNLIRLSAALQAQKDDKHPYPATIVINPDLFGEWQKNKENGSFQDTYCGGKEDKECKTLKAIEIKDALKQAIDAEEHYKVQRYSKNQLTDYKSLAELYDLDEIKNSIDATIEDNIKGWVQSQNLIIRLFAKDVPFSWLINLWAPGSANWVHEKYSSEGAVWNAASASVAKFLKFIGAYEGPYRPDFLTFDKYERDGFGAAGRGNYAFNATAWDNYLMYVKQITDAIDTPAMIWQIPGGHMPTKDEDYSGEAHLCENGESSGCFDPLVHSASGGTYFMGDENIGYNIDNIINKVLTIPLFGAHYSYGTDVKVDNVKKLLEIDEIVDNKHDWSKPQLRKAVDSNAFAILWGGGETTGAVPISTNKTGGYAWLSRKIKAYETSGKIPLYHKEDTGSNSRLTSLDSLNSELTGLTEKMNNEVLLYDTGTGFVPSTIYKWGDFLDALRVMHNSGVAGDTYWLYDDTDSETKKSLYAKTAIAAFLAQSMQETIQYDACDENSWQFIKDTATSEAVRQSYERGDFTVNLPMDAACGQLGQDYESYGVDANGMDNPYSCPKAPNMEVTAVTNAKYYGAAGPLFAGPDSLFEEAGFYIDGKPGRWEYGFHCQGAPATDSNFKTPKLQAWEREECKIYKGQKAGKYVWDGSSKRSLQGCVWWGRGVIQTTGRENFGKLNHYLGRSHVNKKLIGKKVAWADTLVEVVPAPKNPLYADIDFCATPESICSSKKHKELKWIAGLFYWMNAVQSYKGTGKYAGWDYKTELKKYVDSDFGKNGYTPLNGISFIDAISGIVNRGCPDTTCPVSGLVHGGVNRKQNFIKVLKTFGINDIH